MAKDLANVAGWLVLGALLVGSIACDRKINEVRGPVDGGSLVATAR